MGWLTEYTKCRGCKELIGDALACPKCGKKAPPPLTTKGKIGLGLFFGVMGMAALGICAKKEPGGDRVAAYPGADRAVSPRAAPKDEPGSATDVVKRMVLAQTPEHDAVREKTLKKLARDGVFHRVDYLGGATAIQVGPRFYALPFDQKTFAVNQVLVQAMRANIDATAIQLNDARTNKLVGYASPNGLSLQD